MTAYEKEVLSPEETERLQRVYDDLMALCACDVPAVQAHARTAVAHIAQALNGQGLAFDLYTKSWAEE